MTSARYLLRQDDGEYFCCDPDGYQMWSTPDRGKASWWTKEDARDWVDNEEGLTMERDDG